MNNKANKPAKMNKIALGLALALGFSGGALAAEEKSAWRNFWENSHAELGYYSADESGVNFGWGYRTHKDQGLTAKLNLLYLSDATKGSAELGYLKKIEDHTILGYMGFGRYAIDLPGGRLRETQSFLSGRLAYEYQLLPKAVIGGQYVFEDYKEGSNNRLGSITINKVGVLARYQLTSRLALDASYTSILTSNAGDDELRVGVQWRHY